MNRTELIEKLRKIRDLANKGVAGEMSNANAKLVELMDKFGITDDELDEKDESNMFTIDAREQTQLAVQIIHTFLPTKTPIRDISKMPMRDRKIFEEAGFGSRNANLAFECTRSEYVQVLFLYQTYLEDYKKQLAAFEYAYYSANNLLPPKDGNIESKDVDNDVFEQAAQMRDTIRRKEVRKALDVAESNTRTQNSNQYAIDY